ncbi:hypothetical protein Tco_0399680 [Tanacetum coccineum]
MPILHSFKENNLVYEDEYEVKIKMMGTRIDKEFLEHNLHENDITSIICHNVYITANPPIKPKDSDSFRMKRTDRGLKVSAYGSEMEDGRGVVVVS